MGARAQHACRCCGAGRPSLFSLRIKHLADCHLAKADLSSVFLYGDKDTYHVYETDGRPSYDTGRPRRQSLCGPVQQWVQVRCQWIPSAFRMAQPGVNGLVGDYSQRPAGRSTTSLSSGPPAGRRLSASGSPA